MNLLIKILKRYKYFLFSVSILIIIGLFSLNLFLNVLNSVKSNILQMLSVLPPIMILLGLMDIWIPRETLMKYMGKKSGIIGIVLAMLIGSISDRYSWSLNYELLCKCFNARK